MVAFDEFGGGFLIAFTGLDEVAERFPQVLQRSRHGVLHEIRLAHSQLVPFAQAARSFVVQRVAGGFHLFKQFVRLIERFRHTTHHITLAQ